MLDLLTHAAALIAAAAVLGLLFLFLFPPLYELGSLLFGDVLRPILDLWRRWADWWIEKGREWRRS